MEAEDSVSGEKCMKTRFQEGTTEGTSESKMGRVSSDDWSQFRNKVRKRKSLPTWILKWHMAKRSELTATAAPLDMNRAREDRRKPLNMAWKSNTGIRIHTERGHIE